MGLNSCCQKHNVQRKVCVCVWVQAPLSFLNERQINQLSLALSDKPAVVILSVPSPGRLPLTFHFSTVLPAFLLLLPSQHSGSNKHSKIKILQYDNLVITAATARYLLIFRGHKLVSYKPGQRVPVGLSQKATSSLCTNLSTYGKYSKAGQAQQQRKLQL